MFHYCKLPVFPHSGWIRQAPTQRECSGMSRISPQEFDKLGTASLITRTTNDITQVQNVLTMMPRMMIMAPMMCIGGIFMAVSQDAKLSTIFLVVFARTCGSHRFDRFQRIPAVQADSEKAGPA